MSAATRCLEVVFGKGDSDYPFWLLTVRINILLFVLCAVVVIVWNLSPARIRRRPAGQSDLLIILALTILAALLRFVLARANLMDHGGIAYSRLLLGYKGYFGTAQFFSLFYDLTARDIEHAILFNRIAGTLTIPLVYILCRLIEPSAKLLPATAALLFATYPLHILFSASDALAVFSCCLAGAAYALIAGAVALDTDHAGRAAGIHYLAGFIGLALLTQLRYENVLFILPAVWFLFARRQTLRKSRQFVAALTIAGMLMLIYGYEIAASGLSYQTPVNPGETLDIIERYLVLNPFFAVPVVFVGAAAVRLLKGPWVGDLALLPWVGAFLLTVFTTDSSHSAARVYANWLILILPLAAYGFSLMLNAAWGPRLLALLALLYLILQPAIVRDSLAAEYLEILENNQFKAMLMNPPAGTKWLIVPDDELMHRQSRSTLEVFSKYTMIAESTPKTGRPQLVGLTNYLENPRQWNCVAGACVFFFGLPCMEEKLYPLIKDQCEELLRTHRTSMLGSATLDAAPFVSCSIFSGALRDQMCDPATTPRHFAVYRVEE